MPRALTEKEKCAQCKRLLEKGKEVVMSYGVRKVSVDDIVKNAGFAKGSFYQHFESKEQYLYRLIEKMHHDLFLVAEQMIRDRIADEPNFAENVRDFLHKLFSMPELVFFIQNEQDISVIFEAASDGELQNFKQAEKALFERILHLFGIDIKKVKPGIVHNYIHALFLMKSSEYMIEEDLEESMDLILDDLIAYVFGGV